MSGDLVLTGGTGFIGGHLKRRLAGQGIALTEITRDAVVTPRGSHLHGGDSAAIAEALAGLSEPVLIHLAGLVVLRHEPADIAPLMQANVTFAAQVFDGFHKAGYRAVLNAGTSWQFDAEGHPAPTNLYAASKIAGQAILDYYVQSVGMSAMSLVIYDTYGPGDPRPKLIPLLRKTWLEGNELKMTSGVQPINLTHVDDVADALMQAAENVRAQAPGHHEQAAICSTHDISVRELVETIRNKFAPDLQVRLGAIPDGPAPRALCHTIPRVAHWSERVPLVEGIRSIFQRDVV